MDALHIFMRGKPSVGPIAMINNGNTQPLRHSEDLLKRGFASMLQGGVIMDVVTPDQAAVAEAAGAVSVRVRAQRFLPARHLDVRCTLRLTHYSPH